MTETMRAVTATANVNNDDAMASSPTPEELATTRELVRAAQARGVSFADTADGVLKALTKTVVRTALEEELWINLGYDKYDPVGSNGANSRNGTRTKTVLTYTVGEIEIQVPRDRDGSFEPQIVKKRSDRLIVAPGSCCRCIWFRPAWNNRVSPCRRERCSRAALRVSHIVGIHCQAGLFVRLSCSEIFHFPSPLKRLCSMARTHCGQVSDLRVIHPIRRSVVWLLAPKGLRSAPVWR
jgi:mutator family transposase